MKAPIQRPKQAGRHFFVLWLIALLLFVHCVHSQDISNNPTNGIKLPEGFKLMEVAESLGQGRHIVINSNGDIYVSLGRLKNKCGIVALRDTNNDAKADIIKYFGKYSGTGIGIYNGYLYMGADTIIIRYKLLPGELVPDTTAEIIAKGFLVNYQHAAKSLTFDNSGYMYVNVGTPSNACQNPDRTLHTPGDDPCLLLLKYGGIWRFDANKTGQDQLKDGHRYATGLRNCVALRWNPVADHLYAVQHGRDQLHEFWPEHYSADDGVNLPAEEFFLLNDGSDCGWPYCYYDNKQEKKLLAPEYGGDSKSVGRCEDKEKPIMAFPAHYAPNDLIFYTGNMFPAKYKNGAFIAFHGSWNRAPQEQKGYNVVFVPFNSDKPSGNWEVFADNFAGTQKIKSPHDAKARPCGLAQGPDGSLYVIDDTTGKIWKITYTQ
jgi:glucose/arabinose dehydrogenase